MTERERLEEALVRTRNLKREWCDDGKLIMEAARKHLATLPRPPRKVHVTRWLAVCGSESAVFVQREMAAQHAGPFGHVVELTGEYVE
jgi:hypothetical protein